ncbi:ATP-grasp fold amidoligase family protein [uncultured Odoribacter sp.]|uniref:ATP-grasp fold amidoligase family protein n=1 Tax=uncultured Odoribacter sp. TaxID=876416 RepID=UPI0026210402|nr:ATP-grasp fold amidoligase family protein [uncultured Odoribacter sp.]
MEKYIKKALLVVYRRTWEFMATHFNDRFYIRIKYLLNLHKLPNLNRPQTFQEKLQWIKLNDRKPIYHDMVDKVEVKKFIANKIGEEYVIPTLGVWNSFDEIDFESLPNQFILKGTFDSGTYCLCKDKRTFNIEEARKRLLVTWGQDYYIWSREWPYKGLKQRIIAEPLLKDCKEEYLTDYKFFTFNSEPKFFYITSNRNGIGGLKEDFFDVDGTLMELNQKGYYNNPQIPQLPKNLSKMLNFSKKLAENTYHLRVDFYEVSGKLYCGELTFFDGGGFCSFIPVKYNKILGDWIKLPIDKT